MHFSRYYYTFLYFLFLLKLLQLLLQYENLQHDKSDNHWISAVSLTIHINDVEERLKNLMTEMLQKLESYERNGSGWTIIGFLQCDLVVTFANPLSGSSYIETPRHLALKKLIINVKNLNDNMCFKWAIISALKPVEKHTERLSNYNNYPDLDPLFDGLKYPVTLNQISAFERG